jgi:hypothetical protein
MNREARRSQEIGNLQWRRHEKRPQKQRFFLSDSKGDSRFHAPDELRIEDSRYTDGFPWQGFRSCHVVVSIKWTKKREKIRRYLCFRKGKVPWAQEACLGALALDRQGEMRPDFATGRLYSSRVIVSADQTKAQPISFCRRSMFWTSPHRILGWNQSADRRTGDSPVANPWSPAGTLAVLRGSAKMPRLMHNRMILLSRRLPNRSCRSRIYVVSVSELNLDELLHVHSSIARDTKPTQYNLFVWDSASPNATDRGRLGSLFPILSSSSALWVCV